MHELALMMTYGQIPGKIRHWKSNYEWTSVGTVQCAGNISCAKETRSLPAHSQVLADPASFSKMLQREITTNSNCRSLI